MRRPDEAPAVSSASAGGGSGRASSPECPHRLTEVPTHQDLARPPGVWELRQLGAPAARRCPSPPPDSTPSVAMVIPRRAAWFSYRSVHRIERLAFPQFFSASAPAGRSGPALYTAYRNCIIDTYRTFPRRRLTLSACARRLRGDVRAIAGLHSFLEHWGLINLHTEPGLAVPCHLLASAHQAHVTTAEALAPAPAPGLRDFGPAPGGTQPNNRPAAAAANNSNVGSFGLRLDQATGGGPARSVGVRDLWSELEVLALLEAVELFGGDWARVADRVGGGRTQEDCIAQFCRLPIADPYLEGAEQSLGPLAETPAPFSRAANPVMCTVAFLAASVDPRVASAAALAAMAEFGRLRPGCSGADLDAASGRIAETALRAGADKAAQLSVNERDRLRASLASLLDAQMRRLELKLRHLADLEAFVQRELDCAEARGQQVAQERVSFHGQLLRSAEATAAAAAIASAAAGGESSEGNNGGPQQS